MRRLLWICLFFFLICCGFERAAADAYSWQALTAELRAEFPQESPLALAQFARALRNNNVSPVCWSWQTDRARKFVRLWNLARSGQEIGHLGAILPFYSRAPRCAGLIRTQINGLNPAEFQGKLFFTPEKAPIRGILTAKIDLHSHFFADFPAETNQTRFPVQAWDVSQNMRYDDLLFYSKVRHPLIFPSPAASRPPGNAA